MDYTVFSIGREGKIKTFQGLKAAASHNARMNYDASNKIISNANPEICKYNIDLTPLLKGYDKVRFSSIADKSNYEGFKFVDKWYERMRNVSYYADRGYTNIKKNTNLALEFILSYSGSAADNILFSSSDWIKRNIEWMNNTFNVAPDGNNNILSAILHRDESTDHIHLLVIPIDEDGRLNSQRWIGGTLKMRKLRQSYDAAMEPLGLHPGNPHSRTSKDNLPELYRAIRDEEESIPEKEIDETIEAYEERIKDYLRVKVGHQRIEILKERNKMLQEVSEKDQQIQQNELELEKLRTEKLEEVKKLEKKKEDIERKISENDEYLKKQSNIIDNAYLFNLIRYCEKYYENNPEVKSYFNGVWNAIDSINQDDMNIIIQESWKEIEDTKS